MSQTRTFRQLLSQYRDSQELFNWLFDKHVSAVFYKAEKWTPEERMQQRERCMLAYIKVIQELLSKKRVKAGSMPICVRWTVNYGETERYLDTTYKNPKYTPPAKGLKPWGGKAPKGHYNCNANKYNEHFAFGYEPWSKIIDTPVIFDSDEKIGDVEALGAILWELTFHGFSEKECNAFTKKLNKTLSDRMDDIKKDL
jgi:hypothetical protein